MRIGLSKETRVVVVGLFFFAWSSVGCVNSPPGQVEASGEPVPEAIEPPPKQQSEPSESSPSVAAVPATETTPADPVVPATPAPPATPAQPAEAAAPVETVSDPPAAPPVPVTAPEPVVEAEAPRVDIPETVFVEIPSGTVLELELLTALDSSVNRAGDTIQAHTTSPIYVGGKQVLGSGAYVEGRITEAKASGKVKGRASLGFTFDRLQTGEGVEEIRSSYVEREASDGKKKDAAVIGGSAGVGALLGAIIGGKKGAAIGATIGGAGGAGVVLSTKGEEIRLPVGTLVNVRLDQPVTIPVH